MSRLNISQYPPSYSYSEIVDKTKRKNRSLYYCYMGDNSGSIIISDNNGNAKKINYDGDFNIEVDKSLSGHELWTIADEVKDNTIFRDVMMNVLFHVYCSFYYFLDNNDIGVFEKILNQGEIMNG